MTEISEKVFLPQTENELFRASASIKHARGLMLLLYEASQREIMRARPFYENCPLAQIRISLMSLRQFHAACSVISTPACARCENASFCHRRNGKDQVVEFTRRLDFFLRRLPELYKTNTIIAKDLVYLCLRNVYQAKLTSFLSKKGI